MYGLSPTANYRYTQDTVRNVLCIWTFLPLLMVENTWNFLDILLPSTARNMQNFSPEFHRQVAQMFGYTSLKNVRFKSHSQLSLQSRHGQEHIVYLSFSPWLIVENIWNFLDILLPSTVRNMQNFSPDFYRQVALMFGYTSLKNVRFKSHSQLSLHARNAQKLIVYLIFSPWLIVENIWNFLDILLPSTARNIHNFSPDFYRQVAQMFGYTSLKNVRFKSHSQLSLHARNAQKLIVYLIFSPWLIVENIWNFLDILLPSTARNIHNFSPDFYRQVAQMFGYTSLKNVRFKSHSQLSLHARNAQKLIVYLIFSPWLIVENNRYFLDILLPSTARNMQNFSPDFYRQVAQMFGYTP